MNKRSPIAIFLAASALLSSSSTINPEISHAAEGKGCTYKERMEARRKGVKCTSLKNEQGGLKEWTTDQSIESESALDEAAKKQKKKAEDEDICIPVGEGENCW